MLSCKVASGFHFKNTWPVWTTNDFPVQIGKHEGVLWMLENGIDPTDLISASLRVFGCYERFKEGTEVDCFVFGQVRLSGSIGFLHPQLQRRLERADTDSSRGITGANTLLANT